MGKALRFLVRVLSLPASVFFVASLVGLEAHGCIGAYTVSTWFVGNLHADWPTAVRQDGLSALVGYPLHEGVRNACIAVRDATQVPATEWASITLLDASVALVTLSLWCLGGVACARYFFRSVTSTAITVAVIGVPLLGAAAGGFSLLTGSHACESDTIAGALCGLGAAMSWEQAVRTFAMLVITSHFALGTYLG